MKRLLTVGVGLVWGLGACTIGPEYVKPSPPPSSAFKETASQPGSPDWKKSTPRDDVLRGQWWLIYADPELSKLEEQAGPANQTLKLAEANMRRARTLVTYSRASRLPTVTTSSYYSDGRASPNAPSQNVKAKPARDWGQDFNLSFEFSYEIDFWGRVRRSIAASQAQAQASVADLETARLSIHSEIAIDYFELRAADAEKALLEITVTAYRRALELVKARAREGIAPKSDISQAETQLDAALVQTTEIAIARGRYEHALAVLIGKPPSEFALAERPLDAKPPLLPQIPTGLPSALLERRPDIAALERRMAAANEQIGLAEIAYYPTVNLAALVGVESTSVASLFNWPSRLWAVGPMVSQTLFDGGRRRATSEAAQANYEATVAEYQQTALDSFQQVEDNLLALRVLREEVRQQHETTVAAKETYRLFQARYQEGADTYLQVVTAETNALENQRHDIDLLRRQCLAHVALVKALGGGWDSGSLPKF